MLSRSWDAYAQPGRNSNEGLPSLVPLYGRRQGPYAARGGPRMPKARACGALGSGCARAGP